MVHFITGRAGSGKTEYVRNVLKGNAKNGLGNMILIVPEQFSFESEKWILSTLGPKDALKIDVLSFTRLAQSVFSTYGGLCNNLIDDGHKILLMSLALENIKDELVLYSKYVKSTSFIEKMLHICTEFKQRKITPNDLISATKNITSTILKQKLTELSLIYASFNSYLSNSFSDELDLLTKLSDVLSETNHFKDRCVVIDAFKGFTAQEFDVISKIMSQAKDVYITLTTDNIYNSQDETNLFNCVNQTAKKLIKIAKDNNVQIENKIKLPIKNNTRFKNEELKHLENNIFNPAYDIYETPTKNITLCCAASIIEECNYVACTAKKLIRTQGLRCKDIAVITRNADTYKSSLINSFEKYDIPYFEDERQPIISQPLITLVRCLLEISFKGLSTDRVLRYLKTGLTNINDEEISILENYALMWEPNWSKSWTQHPDGLGKEVTESSNKKLEQINDIKNKCVIPLLSFKKKCKETNAKDICKHIYSHLDNLHVQNSLKELALLYEQNSNLALALEQERIWEILMDVLNNIATSIGELPITISRFSEIFDGVLSLTDIGSIPQGLDEITIGNADRIRLSSPKVVFVMGANEGVFPQTPDGKGILNDNDRKKLIEIGLEVDNPSEYKVSEENFIAYNALCSASELLYVSYSRSTSSGEALSPSCIVSEINSIFPNCTTVSTDQLESTYFIESKKSAFEICAKNFREENVLGSTLKEYFKTDKIYNKKLEALSRVSNKKNAKFKDSKNSLDLFGKNLYLSPSRIEDYFKCPFEYFCKHGIKALPRRKATLDPMQSGTLIHFLLEKLLRKYSKEELCNLTQSERHTEVMNLLREYVNDNMGGLDDKSKRFEYLYFRLCKVVDDVLNRICAEFENSYFEPVDFELSIDNDGDLKPYEIELDDGGTLKVRGKIDRVDQFVNDDKSYIRIVDYKSGEKVFELSDVLQGLNLQMLIYLFTIWKNGTERYGDVVPCGIIYYPAKLKVSKIPRESTEIDIANDKIKQGKCNGLFLNNLSVLNAMENDLEGKFIPIKTKKDGSLTGTLIDLSSLGKLNEKIDILLKDMAQSLHNGHIPAYPAQCSKGTSNYNNVCVYCDYKSVCGFEQTDETRLFDSISHKDALEILDKEDDESAMD